LSGKPYPLPFHPLDLGEEALRALSGSSWRGAPTRTTSSDAHLHGFRVADPTGREQAEREATMQEILRRMKPPRRYRMMLDGTLRELSDDES
jgi:hypothetical protein